MRFQRLLAALLALAASSTCLAQVMLRGKAQPSPAGRGLEARQVWQGDIRCKVGTDPTLKKHAATLRISALNPVRAEFSFATPDGGAATLRLLQAEVPPDAELPPQLRQRAVNPAEVVVLKPDGWVTRPEGTEEVTVLGRLVDGGNVFRGTLRTSGPCNSIFTLVLEGTAIAETAAQGPAGKAAGIALFGVEIGKPMGWLECPDQASGSYSPHRAGPGASFPLKSCALRKGPAVVDGVEAAEAFILVFAEPEAPLWIRSESTRFGPRKVMRAYALADGTVGFIEVAALSDEAEVQARQKFGEPTGAFGNPGGSMRLVWQREGGEVAMVRESTAWRRQIVIDPGLAIEGETQISHKYYLFGASSAWNALLTEKAQQKQRQQSEAERKRRPL